MAAAATAGVNQQADEAMPEGVMLSTSDELTVEALRAHSTDASGRNGDVDDDMASVATSAVSYESTIHGHQRRIQRGMSRRDVQAALKHGQRYQDNSNSCFRFRHQATVIVTAADQHTVVTTYREGGDKTSAAAACWPCNSEMQLEQLEQYLGDLTLESARGAVAEWLSAGCDLADFGHAALSAADALLKQRHRRLNQRFPGRGDAAVMLDVEAVVAEIVAALEKSPAEPEGSYYIAKAEDESKEAEDEWLLSHKEAPALRSLRDPAAAARAFEAAAAEALISGDKFVEMALLPFDPQVALELFHASMALRSWPPATTTTITTTTTTVDDRATWVRLLFACACVLMRPAIIIVSTDPAAAAAAAIAAAMFTEAEEVGTTAAFDVAFKVCSHDLTVRAAPRAHNLPRLVSMSAQTALSAHIAVYPHRRALYPVPCALHRRP